MLCGRQAKLSAMLFFARRAPRSGGTSTICATSWKRRQYPPPPVSPQSFTPEKKRGLRREFLLPGLVIASVIFFFAVLDSVLSLSGNKERAMVNPQPKAHGADDLLVDAESALRGGELARSANSLNRISSQYPDSRQADTVRDLALFLRDGNTSQTGPITVSEAERRFNA